MISPDGPWVVLMQETSEEVRLKVVQMIAGPVVERCGPQLSQHAAALASILQQALADPFHEVKKVTSWLPVRAQCLPSTTLVSSLCDLKHFVATEKQLLVFWLQQGTLLTSSFQDETWLLWPFITPPAACW